MIIDDTQFPLVKLSLKAADDSSRASLYTQFEAVLARREAFVLLNDEGLDQGDKPQSHEERRQASLWMKRHREPLRTYVKAAIYIEPSAGKRLATRDFSVIYEKFWGYPMVLVATHDDALAAARDLLAQGR